MQGGSDNKPGKETIPENWADEGPEGGSDPAQTQLTTGSPGSTDVKVPAAESTEVIDATGIVERSLEEIESADQDVTQIRGPAPDQRDGVTQIQTPPPAAAPADNDVTQIQTPPPAAVPADNDVTQISTPLPTASDNDVTQIQAPPTAAATDNDVTQIQAPRLTATSADNDVTQVTGPPLAAPARDDATAVRPAPVDDGGVTQVMDSVPSPQANTSAVPAGDATAVMDADATALIDPDATALLDEDATSVLDADATAVTGTGSTHVTPGAQQAPPPNRGTRGRGTGRTGGTTGFGESLSAGKDVKLAVGDVVDQRFVLVEELGRGGMSVVFRARDAIKEEAGDANPYVALKILHGDFSLHPDAWIALQQEISKTQSLAHPNIVTVHDFKIDRELGLPFAQMEEMRGESLEDLIKRHPDGLEDPKEIERILMAIADGLGYAHDSGIVHADLKPSNVFITEDEEVKLLDFGIARFIPGKKKNQGGREEVFGEGGLSALTPTYASPEMFAGESPLPADDMYALGVIAVELGSGDHPFTSVLGSPKPAVAAADAGLVPERFPGLKNSQWKAIAACLKADRDERPADGYAFKTMFQPKSIWLRALSTLSAMLAIAVVVVWYQAQQIRPDIPFEELPMDTQQKIQDLFTEGEIALRYDDVNGALVSYAEAFEFHPNNADAIEGHEAALDLIMSQPEPTSQNDLRRRLQQANGLQAYPALENSRKLKRYIRDLERMQLN